MAVACHVTRRKRHLPTTADGVARFICDALPAPSTPAEQVGFQYAAKARLASRPEERKVRRAGLQAGPARRWARLLQGAWRWWALFQRDVSRVLGARRRSNGLMGPGWSRRLSDSAFLGRVNPLALHCLAGIWPGPKTA
jgi:hypothetical protein